MKRLAIYPTFLCPFSCPFCLTQKSNSLNQILNIDSIIKLDIEKGKYKDDILTPIMKNVSEVVISGGDPLSLDFEVLNHIICLLERRYFMENITLEAYPYDDEIIKKIRSFHPSVKFNFSYDFMVRPRALEAWQNLMNFDFPFKVTVTISPLLFKLFPNAMLYKLSMLKNVTEVEFVPYCKNECNEYDITKNNTLVKFNKLLLSTKLNLPYKLTNKVKLINKMLEEEDSEVDICLMPDGSLKYKDFDDEILKFKDLTNDVLDNYTPFVYPKNIDLYNDDIVEWAKADEVI